MTVNEKMIACMIFTVVTSDIRHSFYSLLPSPPGPPSLMISPPPSFLPVSLDLLAVDLKQITREMKEATAELINNKQNKPLKVTAAILLH